MSFYATAFVGMAPLGSLMAGSLASRIGAVHTVQLAGAMCVVGSLLFTRQLPALRKIVRPIYQQMGILPEATFGVPSAEGTPLIPLERDRPAAGVTVHRPAGDWSHFSAEKWTSC